MVNSRKIEDLVPAAQEKCRALLTLCEKNNIKVTVIQTLRDAEYQNSLFQSGRTKPGKIVTNCDGFRKKSNHQSGKAFDIVPVDAKGQILWNDSNKFRQIADLAISLGLTAAFYWKKFPDSPHIELN
jgi:hypothetical protein